mmetsp:Transcript_27394/g.59490  ORF Transcript_27394/g.59490 Transcript_27394/m.59490 type:complete len:211 (-) Transcript_27394:435-1067(-)
MPPGMFPCIFPCIFPCMSRKPPPGISQRAASCCPGMYCWPMPEGIPCIPCIPPPYGRGGGGGGWGCWLSAARAWPTLTLGAPPPWDKPDKSCWNWGLCFASARALPKSGLEASNAEASWRVSRVPPATFSAANTDGAGDGRGGGGGGGCCCMRLGCCIGGGTRLASDSANEESCLRSKPATLAPPTAPTAPTPTPGGAAGGTLDPSMDKS